MNIRIKHSGFSLIEVLVALVVLAVGILGISKLQGVLIANSSDANQRTVAVSLAQQKLDDLKSFAQLDFDVDDDGVDETWDDGLPPEQQSYAFIADSEGGQICPAGIATSTACPDADDLISVGNNYLYSLDWTAVEYYYTEPNDLSTARTAAEITAAGETVPSSSDFKLATVTVGWDDEDGDTQTINIQSIIDAYAPALTALSDNGKEGGTPPLVEYTPEAAPDVINVEVDTGGDKFRQTSKPLPDAVKTGQDANTIVTFDVVTYSTYNGDLPFDFIADTLEEYVTVDCKCQFSSTNATARTAAHVRWDSDTNSRHDYEGDLVSKQTATQVDNANDAEELCTTCCRDHHDDATAYPDKPVYVPGTTSGNHIHYQEDGTTEASQASGDIYVESCRMKRVDGIYRVFQDWQLYDITTMLRSDLADGETLQTTYSTYVENFILTEVDPNPDVTATKPDDDTDISTSEGALHQLQSRGVYIDEVYEPETATVSSAYLNYIDDSGNADRLDKIPFAEVNLTLLANWGSADPNHVTVTNEPVATIADPDTDYYGTYSRGFIEAVLDSGGVEIPVTATISDNNNGLTQITDLSNVDEADPVQVVVGPPGDEITFSGTYSFDYPTGYDPTKVSVSISMTGDDDGVCAFKDVNGDGITENEFECGMTSPWTGDIIIETTLKGNPKCTGTITYSGSNETTGNDTLSLSGTCS